MTAGPGAEPSPLPYREYDPPKVYWEDYPRWALSNEFPSEWVDTEIIDVSTPSVRHQCIKGLLIQLLDAAVGRRELGLTIFGILMRLSERPSGRVPDIM